MAKRRRRGSFRLNARGWVYLALSLSVAFAATYKGSNFLLTLFAVLTGILGVSGLLTYLVGRGLEISRVLPEYPIIDVPVEHAIRHTMYDLKAIPQVTAIQNWRGTGGSTSERGSHV